MADDVRLARIESRACSTDRRYTRAAWMRDFTFVHERIGTPAPVRLVLTLAEVYMRLLERASSDLPSQLVSLDRITGV